VPQVVEGVANVGGGKEICKEKQISKKKEDWKEKGNAKGEGGLRERYVGGELRWGYR